MQKEIGWLALLPWLWCCSVLACSAAAPSAEELLPEDTLAVVTAPDFSALRRWFQASPQSRLWNDPAMKPFRDQWLSKWRTEFLEPLQRELAVRLEDYASLPQGQVTLALVPGGDSGREAPSATWLLLVDTRTKSSQLRTNLAGLRKSWIDANKPIRTERIHNLEFTVVTLSSNDTPKTWKKFFPGRPEVQELSSDTDLAKPPPPPDQLVLGQADSLLLAGSSTRSVERVVIRLSGGGLPALSASAAYQADRRALFQGAPVYGWINMKGLAQLLVSSPEPVAGAALPEPIAGLKLDHLLPATGLAALKSVALTLRHTAEGDLLQVCFAVAQGNRVGVLKLLEGEPKDASPPPFVPIDTVKFQRWRIEGHKAWDTVAQVLDELSPGALNGLDLLIDTANERIRETDPGFDLRSSLLTNLGDDLIWYKKAPRPNSPPDTGPGLVLVGSPNPGQLAAALKSLLLFMSAPDASTAEREFLGRKIFSIPMVPIQLLLGNPGRPAPPVLLHYTVGGSYLALSTDVPVLEEYLRNLQGQCKGLRELSGLPEALQQVSGGRWCLFGYKNETETLRPTFDALKKDPAAATNSPAWLPWAQLPLLGTVWHAFAPMMDPSLLPPFEVLAKYLSFTAYGATATTDGVAFRLFAPVPPQLRRGPGLD